ncbi:MAG: hypothetical protein LBD44_06880 [Spirochaetaceae bacterium]|jgi:chromosome segregation ATPase|nr:hypothetical protein [Spirochaetaceae bacterium]
MNFFNGGDLLTLGIVLAALLLFRYLDKGSRNIRLARAYGKELKDEIKKEFTVLTDEKAAALRDYGVILDGDFKRAEALKQNVEAEIKNLGKNLATVNELSTRIQKYESTLRELDSWTEKVEENLRFIGSESAYVELVAKKVDASNHKLNEIDKTIDAIQNRIKTETEQSVKEISGAVLQSIQVTVTSLKNTVDEIERGVAEHREAIDQAEVARRQNLEKDMDTINSALQKVLSVTAIHSNELEADLLNELHQNAEKRSAELRQFLIEKTEAVRQMADSRIEVVSKSVEAAKAAWESESELIFEEQQRYKTEWQRTVSELDALALDQRHIWEKVMGDGDAAIEQYRRVQEAQVETLVNMADDAVKLDVELREHIENVKSEIKNDFRAFEADLTKNRGAVLESFNRSVEAIQDKVGSLEKEIGGLKNEAYDRASNNLKEFEESIEDNLAKRAENINSQMNEWRGKLSERFDELRESAETECRRIEHECEETLQQKKKELNANFDEEVKHIKDAFDDLGRSIGAQTERYEKSIKSLETQFQLSMDDARKIVDTTLKTEISRFELQNSERLKKHERETEETMLKTAENIEERLNEIASAVAKSYGDVEAYRTTCTERFNELDTVIEGIRRRTRELNSENEDRLAAVRAKIEETEFEASAQRKEMINAATDKIRVLENEISEADRRIDEFFSKTELIDKTIAIKKDVENKIEDLNADMEKLALHSIEISELKNQFEKIKRMEEDLANKMTQFDIEQQRIERMEINFNRLLQTSQSVEERLKHITNADDMLQEAQIKLRKLDDSMSAAEEKYQRIEKKNQILETTTDGIGKNFKSLQESEALAQKLNGEIQRITVNLEGMRSSVETLAYENEKAQDTMEKLSTLDQTISEIDVRMQNLQKARVWLAELETRLDEKYREVKQQIKLTEKIIDRGKTDNESLSPEIRDNVIRLKKQGWAIDDIVKSLKISRAAVELILETATR